MSNGAIEEAQLTEEVEKMKSRLPGSPGHIWNPKMLMECSWIKKLLTVFESLIFISSLSIFPQFLVLKEEIRSACAAIPFETHLRVYRHLFMLLQPLIVPSRASTSGYRELIFLQTPEENSWKRTESSRPVHGTY